MESNNQTTVSSGQKISPFLWFNDQAEEAMNYYVSIFKNAKILTVVRYGEAGPGPKGAFMCGSFSIEGQQFNVLNGDSQYKFSPATSFLVNCETQEEIDYLWNKLSDGGKHYACGWLDDKFGVTWQITPSRLLNYINDPDPEKSKRVMLAMMKMIKLDIKVLEDAYNNK